MPTVGWVCSLRGAVAAQLLPIGATRPVGQDALTGWDQLFPIILWCKLSAQISRSMPSGATFIKNYCVVQVVCSNKQVHALGCHLY